MLKVDEILIEKGIHPVERILRLIKRGMDPEHELKAWTTLLSYCQPKARHLEEVDGDGAIDITPERISELTDPELKQLALSLLTDGKAQEQASVSPRRNKAAKTAKVSP